ncbi:MAG: hypothetical protein HUJ29_06740 [Gammaproteobacteria bacterium]|nr:hypothetical protein [Gammaproteobacteria bacterium]
MTTLLIRLNNAPEDEVDDIRQLLDENHIDYYETDAGRWGFSVAGIWLRDDSQLQKATELVDTYQREREQRAQARYQEARRSGTNETFIHRILHSPIAVLVYLSLIVLILYLSILPFIQFL